MSGVSSPAPGRQILVTTSQKHTCLEVSSDTEELDWLVQGCLISIGAKLYRTLTLQEQDWTPLACVKKKKK